jgi:hypothetical protein
MTYHVQQECEWREVSCPHCQQTMMFRQLKVSNFNLRGQYISQVAGRFMFPKTRNNTTNTKEDTK